MMRFDIWLPVDPCPGRISEIDVTSTALGSHVSEKQMAKMPPNPYIKWDTYMRDTSDEHENSSFSTSKNDVIDLTSNSKPHSAGLLGPVRIQTNTFKSK